MVFAKYHPGTVLSNCWKQVSNHQCNAVSWNRKADITTRNIWTMWPVLKGNLLRNIGREHSHQNKDVLYLFDLQNEWKYKRKRHGKRGTVQHDSLSPFWPWNSYYVQFKDSTGKTIKSPTVIQSIFFFPCKFITKIFGHVIVCKSCNYAGTDVTSMVEMAVILTVTFT